MAKAPNSHGVPPASVLKLLERYQRARLLLMIARVIARGGKPLPGDRNMVKILAEETQGRPHKGPALDKRRNGQWREIG